MNCGHCFLDASLSFMVLSSDVLLSFDRTDLYYFGNSVWINLSRLEAFGGSHS